MSWIDPARLEEAIMSGGNLKNESDNKEYQASYDAARNGDAGAYAFVTFVVGETDIGRAGREAGEADYAEHGRSD